MLDYLVPRAGRVRVFTGSRAEERAAIFGHLVWAGVLGRVESRAFVEEHGIEIMRRAASEDVNSQGGVLVPDEIAATILQARESYGVFRRNAQPAQMGRDVMYWPRPSGDGLNVVFAGEAGAPDEQDLAADNVALTSQKLMALIRTSAELEEDAVSFGEFLAGEIAYGFAKKEDLVGFAGDGTSTYGGNLGLGPKILGTGHAKAKVTAAAGHSGFGTIDETDIANLIAGVQAAALANAKFYVSTVGYALTFCRLAAKSGGLVANVVNGRLEANYLGFPVEMTQAMPSDAGALTGQAMIAFGDLFRAATLGTRRELVIARSVRAAGMFERDQVLFKATSRVSFNLHDVGDDTNVGPVACLVGTA